MVIFIFVFFLGFVLGWVGRSVLLALRDKEEEPDYWDFYDE